MSINLQKHRYWSIFLIIMISESYTFLTPLPVSLGVFHKVRVKRKSFYTAIESKSTTEQYDWPVKLVESNELIRRSLAFPLGFASAGNWLASCIYVAAKLRIPDALAHGPRTVSELAQELQVDADALGRLMRSLAGQGPIPGLFIEIFATPLWPPPLPWTRRPAPRSDLHRRYALTPMGALLRDGGAGSMRPWAIFCGEELGRAWSAGLRGAVRPG